jgi:hypothetical protein
MPCGQRLSAVAGDPLIVALRTGHQVDELDVLEHAITYREALVEQISEEIDILTATKARIIARQVEAHAVR